MNIELLARIVGVCFVFDRTSNVGEVMCLAKAEIERLEAENSNMAVHVRKVQADRDRLLLANETLKDLCEYVPMTDDEWDLLDLEKNTDGLHAFDWEKIIEAEVIKRAGLVVKERDK